jgi:hypothetical protein
MSQNNPQLDLVKREIDRLIAKSMEQALSESDLKKLESLINMQAKLVDKPAIVYVESYDSIYDRTILSTIAGKRIARSVDEEGNELKVAEELQTKPTKQKKSRTKKI